MTSNRDSFSNFMQREHGLFLMSRVLKSNRPTVDIISFTRVFSIQLLLCVIALFLSQANALGQGILTDITLSSVSTSGSYTGPDVWDTRPAGSYNIWIQNVSTGTFLNGPTDATTRPNIQLVPGVVSFRIFTEPGANYAQFGINVFFNSANLPSISAKGPLLTSSTASHSFSANSGSSTLAANQQRVAGAGTLSCTNNNYRITMSDYFFAQPSVYGVDLVGGYTRGASGYQDYVGGFTLFVTEVPEPQLALWLAGLIMSLSALRKRD